ncbi:unnamed protein product [Pleuronectes platessa]|uniref:Uncharacterized protein n=1 Tax=Pleuronectes platessa TaxID=8262 RepID=A0A9N7UED1_PLEPL|nr:unnamed protein product [Pleuronectes platessa]
MNSNENLLSPSWGNDWSGLACENITQEFSASSTKSNIIQLQSRLSHPKCLNVWIRNCIRCHAIIVHTKLDGSSHWVVLACHNIKGKSLSTVSFSCLEKAKWCDNRCLGYVLWVHRHQVTATD